MTHTARSIVTGAAGFVGSHLCRALLQDGEAVVGIDNFDPFYDRAIKTRNVQELAAHPAFEFVEADIRDHATLDAVFRDSSASTVFHLAALVGVRPSIDAPDRYTSVNLGGLTSVLEASRKHGVRRFLFASSSSVYGNHRLPFREDDRVDEPVSPYAATKRAGELLCKTYSHVFGLSVGVLRFFTVFGPRQRPDLAIATFMRAIAADREVPMFGDGSTSRDYTYVTDITDGVLAAARRVRSAEPGFFRIWNLGGAHPVELRCMIDAIARVIGKPARIRPLPMQPGDVERTYADLTRSAIELAFEPRTSFEDGLQLQWDWIQSCRAGRAYATRP